MDQEGALVGMTETPADLLNHAQELISVVSSGAFSEYKKWLRTDAIQQVLRQEANLDVGQIYVYSEYRVFQREFCRRFADASEASCINAFSKLFLKNDISITQLVDFMESFQARISLADRDSLDA